MQFVTRLPPDVDVRWFFFEDGEFAQTVSESFQSVTIIPMSERVSRAQRGGLPASAVLDSLALVRRLAWGLKAVRPDLVITNSMKAHVLGSIAAKLAGLRCINYIHDLVDGRALDLLRLVSRLCAVERLTCSNLVKSHIRLRNTTVVYATIDVAAFAELPNRHEARRALGLPDSDIPIVGLVGRIARWKGQDRFTFVSLAAQSLAAMTNMLKNYGQMSYDVASRATLPSFPGRKQCKSFMRRSTLRVTAPNGNPLAARRSKPWRRACRLCASTMRAYARFSSKTAAAYGFRRATRALLRQR